MKKLIALFLAVIMVFTLAACGKDNEKSDVKETEALTEDLSKYKVEYPITVTDMLGREVTIEKEPTKLVSAYYISTSALIALGETDNLVAIEAKADTRNIYKAAAPEVIKLPSVGTAKNFDIEACAAVDPDLVVIPVKLQGVIEQLEALGIDVIAVNPESMQDLIVTIALLSKVTDNVHIGNEMIDAYYANISKLSTRLEKLDAHKVYFAGNSSYLMTAGKNMYQNTILNNAKCENVAAELSDTYWAEVSYEQIITWNPEWIVVASDADYSVDDILNDVNLADVDAVKNGKVIKLPSEYESFDSPVPASFLASLWIASRVHTENYTVVEYNVALKEFYETFYGFTPEIEK